MISHFRIYFNEAPAHAGAFYFAYLTNKARNVHFLFVFMVHLTISALKKDELI